MIFRSECSPVLNSPRPFRVESVVFDLFHTIVDPEDFRPIAFHRADKIADIFNLDPHKFREFWESTKHEGCTSRSKKVIDYVQEYVTKTESRQRGAI
jgi:hypothetical protein